MPEPTPAISCYGTGGSPPSTRRKPSSSRTGTPSCSALTSLLPAFSPATR